MMTDPTEPARYAFEYPDEAGYPEGKGTLSQDQEVIIDEVLDDPHAPAFEFEVVKDEKLGIYPTSATTGPHRPQPQAFRPAATVLP